MAISFRDWLLGDPAALAAGRELLEKAGAYHKGSTDVRQAVATVQKRWGDAPTGALNPAQLARLEAEQGDQEAPAKRTRTRKPTS